MLGLDVHSSLVAGLACLIIVGMIKNAVGIAGIKQGMKDVCRRLDKGAERMDSKGL